MGKYANVFLDSVCALPILGTYHCRNLNPDPPKDLIFKKIDSSGSIRLTEDGKILYGSGEFWTLLAEISDSSENQWFIEFEYFGSDVLIQRFDEKMKIEIGVYINPILCSSTVHLDDELR